MLMTVPRIIRFTSVRTIASTPVANTGESPESAEEIATEP